MKRYLVFSYPQFYPNGGWGDLAGRFDNTEEAIVFARRQGAELLSTWGSNGLYTVQIIDAETGEKVYEA